MTHSAKQVADHWSERLSDSHDFARGVYWLALPAVSAYYTRRATRGRRSDSWVNDCVEQFLGQQLPLERVLSIGCGTGELERHLARFPAFLHCDAIDIAPGSIATARLEAEAAGLTNIDYRIGDANTLDLPAAHYDAVWFNSSLHHIAALEQACHQVARCLRPGGWLFLNEYVGAPAFAFSARQIEAIRAAFALIPPELRRRPDADGTMRLALPPIPDPATVAAADPSEAVRSDEILGVVNLFFDIVECNPAGGTLLQFVLNGIAGNFDNDRAETQAVLEMLLRIEETLIDSGDLASDFVVVAARRRDHLPAVRSSAFAGAPGDENGAKSANPDLTSLEAENRQLRRTLAMVESTLVWRVACAYWRTRARLSRLLGFGRRGEDQRANLVP